MIPYLIGAFVGGMLVAIITISLCNAAHESDADLQLRIIAEEAREELARIEQHGGHAGFPKRILAIIWA